MSASGVFKMGGQRLRTLAMWSVASALLALCFRGVDPAQVLAALNRGHPGWLLAAVAFNGAIPLLWAMQWRLFLPRTSVTAHALGFRAVFAVTSVMGMVANSVPFFAGQATGIHLLATRGRVGHATALSVAALDQLAEGLAKLALLLTLAAVTPLPRVLRGALAVLAAGVALLLVVVMSAAWSHGRVRFPIPRRRPFAVALRFVQAWAEGLEGARRPSVLAGGVAIGLAMKGAEVGGILAVQTAFGVDLPGWSALAVLAAVSLSTMISVAPANLGVYEGSAFLTYSALGVAPETALGLAVLQHVAYLAPVSGAGWATLIIVGRGPQAAANASSGRALRASS